MKEYRISIFIISIMLLLSTTETLSSSISFAETSSSFSNNSSSTVLTFVSEGSQDYFILIPADSTVLNATLEITGEPLTQGGTDYSLNPSLDVGKDSTIEWRYNGLSFGNLGWQDRFNQDSQTKEISIGETGWNNTTSILLPKDAKVIGTKIDVEGLATNPNISIMQNFTGNGNETDQFARTSGGDWNGDGYSDLSIGESGFDNNSLSNVGRVSIFYSNQGAFNSTPDVTHVGTFQNQLISRTFSAKRLNNDQYHDFIEPKLNSSVFVYYGSSSGIKSNPDVVLQETPSEFFGWTVESRCDFNDDGYNDLIIGDYGYDGLDYGRIYNYNGSSSGISSSPDFNITGSVSGWQLGAQLACPGDVNKDGYDDLLVGDLAARVYLYLGSGNGLARIPTTTIDFGYFVGMRYHLSGGDINGDGFSDAFMGVYNKDIGGKTSAGAVLFYLGSSTGLSTSPNITINGTYIDGEYGHEPLLIPDLNNDGYNELLVGAPYEPANGESQAGRVYGYFGNSTGLIKEPVFIISGENQNDLFGFYVRDVGDIDKDNKVEISIGALGVSNGTKQYAGKAYLSKPIIHMPINPTINLGDTGGPDWTHSGEYYNNTTIDLIEAKLTSYLSDPPESNIYIDDYGNELVMVPINVTSELDCEMVLSNLNITYNASLRTLDLADQFNSYIAAHQADKDLDGFIDVPLRFSVQSPGKLYIHDINITLDTPPILTEIPDRSLDEDTSVQDLYDLFDFFVDDHNPQENLTFAIESFTNCTFVDVYLNRTHYIDVNATLPGSDNWTGTTEVVVSATDLRDQKRTSNMFTITISPVDDAPVWSRPIETIHILEDGTIYNRSLLDLVEDAENDNLQLEVLGIEDPDVLDVVTNASCGTCLDIWAIKSNHHGRTNITIRVSEVNDTSMFDEGVIPIIIDPVNDPPRFTSIPSPNAVPNITYEYQVTAIDPEDDSFTFSLDKSPDGMSITSSSLLSWTPGETDNGVHTVIINASDGSAYSLQAFDIDVSSSAENLPPFITSVPVENATVGFEYVYKVMATDPNGDVLNYSFVEAPEGMVIDPASGEISWTPDEAQAGNHQISVSVSDELDFVLQVFTINVTTEGMNHKPAISSDPPTHAKATEPYSYKVNASDPDINDTLTYSIVGPQGMSIDTSGLVTWTPEEANAGLNNVTIEVSDGKGTVRQSFTIDVLGNQPPIAVLNASKLKIEKGKKVKFNASGSFDTDGNVVSYFFDFGDGKNSSWVDTPEVKHKFKKTGKYNVTLIVKDDKGRTNSNEMVVTIKVKKSSEGIPGFEVPIIILSVCVLLWITRRLRHSGVT